MLPGAARDFDDQARWRQMFLQNIEDEIAIAQGCRCVESSLVHGAANSLMTLRKTI
jgi:hypothetical protein